MAGVAGQYRLDQSEDVEAGAVGHRRLYGTGVDAAVLGEQLEFLDFLGGGQQVALDPCGDQLHRFRRGAAAGVGQALTNPLRQGIEFDRPDLQVLAVRTVDQRLGPLGLLRTAVEPRQADQQQGVLGRSGQVVEQGGGALVAGLAIGDAQLDQTALGEQREAGAGLVEAAPVEGGVGVEYLAFAVALFAGGGANGIAGFLAEQRLITADHVDGRQGTLQVLLQLARVELHRRVPLAWLTAGWAAAAARPAARRRDAGGLPRRPGLRRVASP